MPVRALRIVLALSLCLLAGLGVSTAAQAGYLVQGGQIYDQSGKRVQLRGVNWFGFETEVKVAHGLWARNWRDMLVQMQKLHINAVRVPVCPDTLRGTEVGAIDYDLNPDLKGLNSLQVLDKLVRGMSDAGMYVLLDHHRPDCKAISELWYTKDYSEAQWVADLVMMAERYRDVRGFIGIDLKNEPHGKATWGTGKRATDWNRAAELAARAVLMRVPEILVFVAGIQENPTCSDNQDAHWWGGNLEPFACTPLDIPPDRLVLSPHVYGPDVHDQSYFQDSDFPRNMPRIWERHFGQFLGQAYSVILGEFGGRYGHDGDPRDRVWQDALVQYLIRKGVDSAFYWSWNPNSGDTGGLLRDDWKSVWDDKLELLYRLWFRGKVPDLPGSSTPACDDGLDNDGDGLIDSADPGCTSGIDNNEYNPSAGEPVSGGVSYQFNGLSDWGAGYCTDVRVTNATDKTLRWRVAVPVDGRVNNLWNGSFDAEHGKIIVTGLHWNENLKPGASAHFGFCAERGKTSAPAKPRDHIQPAEKPNLKTSLRMQSDWQAGYCADVMVKNEGAQPQDWRVTLQIEGRAYNVWKAKHLQRGAFLTAEGEDWNNIVQPGQSVDFGFCANR